jgi:hypothetical protein
LIPCLYPARAADGQAVLFNRDIRPILTETCFACHGFDPAARKAGLRLDSFEGATTPTEKGHAAIVPGKPELSEFWKRVTSPDPTLKMPPPVAHKELKPAQIAMLKRWIEQGANYQKHWAFEPVQRPPTPTVKQTAWPKTDPDRFILATLEANQLAPTKEATRETLLRRLTLDLTGLPPAPVEVDAFIADTAPGAYERAVDRLLASPRYGEHMGRYWLDAARYGDTHGLHLDNERTMWPYRDWVVRAFNENLPFDQFTVWQLAGDLLPEPTRDQLVASGFNRCNVTTSEGGAIDAEFHVRYAVDRVEAASTVFMGLTMGCAVCHDHKLDPITQKEFYQMFAIFNNMAEKAMDGNAELPPPVMKVPTEEQDEELKSLEARQAELAAQMQAAALKVAYTDPASLTNAPAPKPTDVVWIEDDWPPGANVSVNAGNEAHRWVTATEGKVFSGQRAIQRSGSGLHQVFFDKTSRPLTVGAGDKLFAHVFIDPARPPKTLMLQWHTTTWDRRANWGDEDAIAYGAKGTSEKLLLGPLPKAGEWVRLEIEVEKLGLKPGTKITGMAFTQMDGTAWWDQAGIVTVNDPMRDTTRSLVAWEKAERALGDKSMTPANLKAVLKKEPGKRTDAEREQLRGYFIANLYAEAGEPLSGLRTETRKLREQRSAVETKIPSTMVSKELEKPRPAFVLIRGEYDKRGEPVGPGVPAVLPPLPPGETTNRLTLAQWLVDPAHPLTARVTVNRFWQQFFGTGLVKTSEDFGSAGEWPSHPELLDWLATEFVRTGWDVKGLVRLIVTSAAYRQDSLVTPELVARDPENRLLARGPRLRLDAEVLRDSALFTSGLLVEKTGGRGVRPYQPPGIWEAVGYTTSNTAKYTQDKGDALWRRSLYLFWKRTAPPPSMTTFDAPSREQCRVRRERTNTPLQALVTMNDPQYFEAARQLGWRMLHEGGATDADRLRYGFRLVTARAPRQSEQSVLEQNLAAHRARYTADLEAAKKALAVGEAPVPADAAPAELAAFTMVANLLFNLDEVVTKN